VSLFAVGIELRVEADGREKAEAIVREQVQRRRLSPAWDVHVSYSEPFEDE
jgi:predicted pyridoxine 5'-phosphate oxidase superfamily flavin-nucleotide-binding protein